MKNIPKYNELMFPTLKALRHLGGSGNNDEITDTVMELEKYSPEVVNQSHKNGPLTALE